MRAAAAAPWGMRPGGVGVQRWARIGPTRKWGEYAESINWNAVAIETRGDRLACRPPAPVECVPVPSSLAADRADGGARCLGARPGEQHGALLRAAQQIAVHRVDHVHRRRRTLAPRNTDHALRRQQDIAILPWCQHRRVLEG